MASVLVGGYVAIEGQAERIRVSAVRLTIDLKPR
jgi:hypothetical protein